MAVSLVAVSLAVVSPVATGDGLSTGGVGVLFGEEGRIPTGAELQATMNHICEV